MSGDEMLKGWVLEAVGRISGRKGSQGREPSYALGLELQMALKEDLDEAIGALEAEGRVRVGRTLNDMYIEKKEE